MLSDVSALVKPRADRRTIASNLNFVGKMSLLLFTRAFYWGYFLNVIPRDIGHVCLHYSSFHCDSVTHVVDYFSFPILGS